MPLACCLVEAVYAAARGITVDDADPQGMFVCVELLCSFERSFGTLYGDPPVMFQIVPGQAVSGTYPKRILVPVNVELSIAQARKPVL